MKYIYIASKYSDGDQAENVNTVLQVADKLMLAGFTPFVPHLSMIWDVVSPKGYKDWMDYDKQWLLRCDAVLRVLNTSKGADEEVVFAKDNGIPVFFSIKELISANMSR